MITIAGHNRRWIDGSIPILSVMLTTDSIDPLVKEFFIYLLVVSTMDPKILVKQMTIDPLVHIQLIHWPNITRNKKYTHTHVLYISSNIHIHTYPYTYTYTDGYRYTYIFLYLYVLNLYLSL
jgi:hypothetical protein